MRWPWQSKTFDLSTALGRLVAAQEGVLTRFVTPQNCMQSPTMAAIVTAVSRRMASTPVHVYRKTEIDGRAVKKRLPDHSVAQLLRRPNGWQSEYDFWQDATSTLLRWGRFYCYKSRASGGEAGTAGPIRELLPMESGSVTPCQDPKTWRVTFKQTTPGGGFEEHPAGRIFHVRGPARDFLCGDSLVHDVHVAIALEILAEKFGAQFFQNGALPLLLFEYMEGSAGFETDEQAEEFIKDVQRKFSGNSRFRALISPKGIKAPTTLRMDNDKAQFLETRKYQRTVIAGAFGVPPHLVGDLERGTFNNVEQQDKDFTQNVVMPIVRSFESAMERDLLSRDDVSRGIVIRFNLDSTLRAAFKDRQEGLAVQRQNGIINANEWREIEGRNPRDDEEGDDFLHPGNMLVDGESDETSIDGPAGDQGTE